MLRIDELHCTGCGACVQSCPKGCIVFEERELGIRIPVIDPASCVDCHACEKVCPIEVPTGKRAEQRVVAAVNRNREVLRSSTSGGFFTVLAEHVLNGGGVVYGCAFQDDFQARHIRVTQVAELEKLRGSKYLQSDTCDTFREAKKDLLAGETVLYTSTPCQIAGLRAFLGREYENLICVDLVCHGVGSQAFLTSTCSL